MSISITRYVRIISSVTGSAAVAEQKLVGRRFTIDPRVPIGTVVEVGPGGADDYFGSNSPEAKFARQYFGYISPAPASQAAELQFVSYADTPRPPRLYGYPITVSLSGFQLVVNGVMRITVGESDYSIAEIDLSGAVSLSDVASLVAAAINAVSSTPVTVSYDPLGGSFTVESTATGAGLVKVSSSVGQDVGFMMGLVGAQAISSPGSVAQSPLEAFQAAEQVTDSFGSASFGVPVTLEQAVEVAEYVSGENVKYQMYWSVNSSNADEWSAAMLGTASQGLVLNLTPDEYKEALPMAVMAATDYDRTNAAINYMFRQSGVTLTPDVTDDQMANFYDERRVNYYGQTANAGQNISFFQRGSLCGGATAPLDMSVHANEQWFKAYLKAQFMSLFLVTNRVPANLDGNGMVLAVLAGGVIKAKNNKTIIIGKALTELQKVAILQGSGDPLAWYDVQNNGYWAKAEVVQETGSSGVTEYFIKYTIFYSKGDSVRKIEGSHNLV